MRDTSKPVPGGLYTADPTICLNENETAVISIFSRYFKQIVNPIGPHETFIYATSIDYKSLACRSHILIFRCKKIKFDEHGLNNDSFLKHFKLIEAANTIEM